MIRDEMIHYIVHVWTRKDEREPGAFDAVGRFDDEAQFELAQEDGEVETWDVWTTCDIDRVLDLSPGVISYAVVD